MNTKHDIHSHDTEPIVACCTARGAGALALIRVTGNGALGIVASRARLSSGKSLDTVSTHTIHHGTINDSAGNPLDSVLFMVMYGPRTFTGHDTVEISTHNNPFIIDAVIDTLIKAGARLAEPGEFSKRAVLNGKIDLIQAESINECINAATMQGLKASYAQLTGSLSRAIAAIEKRLLHALALSNASFEFIEEENSIFWESICTILDEVSATVQQLIKQFPLQQQLRQGARIVLVGSVNAGKSSLFNALLGTARAIVTPIAGTTRDVIEAGVYHNGEHVTYIDTAGMRITHDTIEKEGIERSYAEANRADMVLVIVDGARKMSAEEAKAYDTLIAAHHHKALLIYTKADLPQITGYEAPKIIPYCSVSTIDTLKIQQCISLLDGVRQKITSNGMVAPYLLNERQCRLLETLVQKLALLKAVLVDGIHYEIIAHHLQEALATISELTGKSVSEAAMDAVFKEFCVGK